MFDPSCGGVLNGKELKTCRRNGCKGFVMLHANMATVFSVLCQTVLQKCQMFLCRAKEVSNSSEFVGLGDFV